jgi:hypothetical protein
LLPYASRDFRIIRSFVPIPEEQHCNKNPVSRAGSLAKITKGFRMEDVTKRFMNLLEQTLIPDFCSDSTRNMNPSCFRKANLTDLSEIDIADFLRGWNAQLYALARIPDR